MTCQKVWYGQDDMLEGVVHARRCGTARTCQKVWYSDDMLEGVVHARRSGTAMTC